VSPIFVLVSNLIFKTLIILNQYNLKYISTNQVLNLFLDITLYEPYIYAIKIRQLQNKDARKTKIKQFQPFKWWPSSKSLGLTDLLPLYSQVQVLWLFIWWSLEVYMVINFRTHGISRDKYKLIRIPILIFLKK